MSKLPEKDEQGKLRRVHPFGQGSRLHATIRRRVGSNSVLPKTVANRDAMLGPVEGLEAAFEKAAIQGACAW
eukprot:6189418-Amphidinium_carterae.2